MALSAHLAELSQKHKLLERRLEEALNHPSADTIQIKSLKQQKLKLKDEIMRLQQNGAQH